MSSRRHYVARRCHAWLRRWKVVRSDLEALPGSRGRVYRIKYVTVSRHITWTKANQACKRLNAQEGHAH